jgi:hypothetical protein
MANAQDLYVSEYPEGLGVDPAIKDFFEKFYALSDNPEVSAEQYADSFTEDGLLKMGKKVAQGQEGL